MRTPQTVVKEFTRMGEGYRHARRNMRNPLDACSVCDSKFADGEQIAALIYARGKNKVACQGCANEIEYGLE